MCARVVVPCEIICYFGVLQQVNQKVNRVFSCQSTVTIHNDVEHKLESLVDVLCIKELMEKQIQTEKMSLTKQCVSQVTYLCSQLK